MVDDIGIENRIEDCNCKRHSTVGTRVHKSKHKQGTLSRNAKIIQALCYVRFVQSPCSRAKDAKWGIQRLGLTLALYTLGDLSACMNSPRANGKEEHIIQMLCTM